MSGGVDSVVLCELCKKAGFDFNIAHCNFQLRGEESERDEKFVRGLGDRYNVEVKVRRFDTEQYAAENKLSIQEAARELRYEWFDKLLRIKEPGVSNQDINKINSQTEYIQTPVHLLTAHHADDNAETVLMNFCRGTGLHGLTGIPVSYGNIRRPLLGFTKEELIAFAKENNLTFVEDSSNLISKYTRNLFRNEILPAISKVYPEVKDNLVDNISRFREIEKLYKYSVAEIKKKLIREKKGEWHIPVKQLMGFNNRALIYEIISAFGFTEKQIDEVIKLADSESGKYVDSPQFHYRIIKHRHWFIISQVYSADSGFIILEKMDHRTGFEEGLLEIELIDAVNYKPKASNEIACLDAKEISFPLILRKWKAGDYFYPLGMPKKKKISRFLIDNKLSRSEKERTWVIESNKRIIWVVGKRIDDRCKITDKTKQLLKITYLPGN